MIILALETATEACSAALALDADIRERFEVAPRGHSALILPMLASLLDEAGIGLTQVDALAFGRGPGAFTGVRIAAGVAQGVAFAADLPVVPVSTLAALAQTAATSHAETHLLAAIDARMDEVYWGAYVRDAGGLVRLQGEEAVLPPGHTPAVEGSTWRGVGSGWSTYGEILAARHGHSLAGQDAAVLPRAAAVARLGAAAFAAGGACDPAQAQPVYLRDRVAWQKSR